MLYIPRPILWAGIKSKHAKWDTFEKIVSFTTWLSFNCKLSTIYDIVRHSFLSFQWGDSLIHYLWHCTSFFFTISMGGLRRTSIDIRFWCLKLIPAQKEQNIYKKGCKAITDEAGRGSSTIAYRLEGGGGVIKRCVTNRSEHNVKKRYEGVRGGGGQQLFKKALRNCWTAPKS